MMDNEQYYKEIEQAAEYIRSRDSRTAPIGIILGSGLGSLAERIERQTIIPYREIPGFPVSTAIGHKGELIIGVMGGKTVIAMRGRFHYYEGYDMRQITLPVRVMSVLGVKYLFVSNAAGGLNTGYEVGDMMLITDHINYGHNPLIGPNLDKFGPRFPDMTEAYSVELGKMAIAAARGMGISLKKGVYLADTGPSYETPAECRCFSLWGADAVGMSTVPEVIVANHCGMKVMGVSVITNAARNFVFDQELMVDGEDVIKAADAVASKMSDLFLNVIQNLTIL